MTPRPRFRRALLPVLLVTSALAFAACADDDDDPPPPEGVSYIRGQVEQGGGYIGAPGRLNPAHEPDAIVTVHRIDADGELVDVTGEADTTDAGGNFLVSATVEDVADLVVQSVKGQTRYRALVSSRVRFDSTVVVAPLNYETTVEADLYASVVSHRFGTTLSAPVVALHVNSFVAAILRGEPGMLGGVALVLEQDPLAQYAHLTAAAVGGTSEQLAQVEAARRAARVTLDRALDAGSENGPATAAAYEAFYAAERQGYVAAGFSLDEAAAARESSARAVRNRTLGLRADLGLAMRQVGAVVRARTLSAAVEAEMAAQAAPAAQQTAVRNAGIVLRNALYVAGDNQIPTAFNDWRVAVASALVASWPAAAAPIAAARDALLTGPRAALEVNVTGALDTDILVNANLAYLAEAETLAAGVLAGTSLTAAQQSGVTRMLVLSAMPF